ncbi:MAG TPA: RNA-directed DNA polymerase [Polyangiaceae bacterium]|nr:RNA-directed DNA polymerase [Polyangiaceae bacterium]
MLVLARAQNRTGKRFALRADISRFYYSLYTHALEWAVHTKGVVKANRAQPVRLRQALWGRALDDRHRDLQDSQSIGIPVGPDTSLVAAELVLGRIDELVSTQINCRGVRFVDEYELCFSNRADAESALSVLQEALAEYELALNPSKTAIFELPGQLDLPWTRLLRRVRVRRAESGQRFDLIDLFVTVSIRTPLENVA